MTQRDLTGLQRAYSIFEMKAFDDETRTIEGVATTPAEDHYGDIVEPKGVEFDLPVPLLWQHKHDAPIGHVTKAKVSNNGIDVVATLVRTDQPGPLKDRLDEAWESIKLGLVRGLSIGFRSIEHAYIEGTHGIRFLKWRWLELSAVTVPANSEASITAIRNIDSQLRAVSGREQRRFVRLLKASPGVSGKSAVTRGPVQLIPRKPIDEEKHC